MKKETLAQHVQAAVTMDALSTAITPRVYMPPVVVKPELEEFFEQFLLGAPTATEQGAVMYVAVKGRCVRVAMREIVAPAPPPPPQEDKAAMEDRDLDVEIVAFLQDRGEPLTIDVIFYAMQDHAIGNGYAPLTEARLVDRVVSLAVDYGKVLRTYVDGETLYAAPDPEPCDACGGTGKAYDVTCVTCGGKKTKENKR